MLISVACSQFSSFSLSPQNYKSVVPAALFIPSVTAGDNYTQEASRGLYIGGRGVRKRAVDPFFKAGDALSTTKG